ncbi:cytochrome d ubiquinol oxidase subunit II [Williamsia sp. 1135]|uniref:cytochrome d ubiquinol oxidase subunit II n=1 Tax=Williamsia sp. 1135 TaxID=1889262 RepID=UPI000A11C37E|nr:cytochrome d ubiquinol oxidase subunit II [Williamsia sp. 1135]ORM30525.1 cytochrome d ubiquinol oxidase subunit II [Williamsia sp. 1135]
MSLPEFWFAIVGFLFLGYFILEGFDFGVGMLMPFLGRAKHGVPGDTRRRAMLNTIGPVWDGNEVWLITGGGALFAAFPAWYATMFSTFYIPLFLILVGLIVRVVSIEWRGKIDDPRWRWWADVGIGMGSWIPAILWGVAFANLVRGLPIDGEEQFTGNFFDLLSPYALLGGVATAMLFATHGAVFLALKTSDELQQDSMRAARWIAVPTTVVAAVWGLWTQIEYGKDWTWVALGVAAVAIISATALAFARREGWAFVATTVAITGVVVLILGSMFPNVIPSTTDPAFDMTIEGSASSHYTLVVITWAAAIITPIVMCYQAWTYWVFRQRISTSHIPPSIGLPLRERKVAEKST